MQENCPFCGAEVHYYDTDDLFRYVEHLESHADDEA